MDKKHLFYDHFHYPRLPLCPRFYASPGPPKPALRITPLCRAQGWQVVGEYVDYESGGKGRDKRTEFDAMFHAAHQRKFDVLLFWALDRLSREGALKTLQYLELLASYGIQYVSFTEPYLNSIGMFREAIVSIIATLAKQEKVRIGERVRAGLLRAKDKGKVGGRPRIASEVEKLILVMKSEGLSNRSIGKRLKISHVSVGRYTKDHNLPNL